MTAPDPFFQKILDWEWNACIGQQGDEQNYVDGYIEAAIGLGETIFEKKLYGQRDTLILPILFNARHAVELSLKFVARKLVSEGVLKSDFKYDHDLYGLFSYLDDVSLGDEQLRIDLERLEPFVASLAQMDSDGQEFRYHLKRDNERSLKSLTVVNLRLVLHSLYDLKKRLDSLRFRAIEYCRERRTGTYTDACSRFDLIEISKMLPPRSQWNDPVFEQARDQVMERYGIGGRQFSIALVKIQNCRQTRTILGMLSELMYLSDAQITRVVGFWRNLQPPSQVTRTGAIVSAAEVVRQAMSDSRRDMYSEVIQTIESELSLQAFAELESLYYLGRDSDFVEYYESDVSERIHRYTSTSNLNAEISHLMEKTNFNDALVRGVSMVGRPMLSEQLRSI